MSMVSIPVPPELEHVLKPVLERDPEKGAELLGVSPWELDDLLQARSLKVTNLPG